MYYQKKKKKKKKFIEKNTLANSLFKVFSIFAMFLC